MAISRYRSAPSHYFRISDLRFWLEEHRIDISQVAEVEIVIGQSRCKEGFGAQARVHYYLTDQHGARFVAGDDAAMGHVTINLHSLPPLREVP